MTQHLTITIGRNVGDGPMNGIAWSHFQLDAHVLASSYGHPVYEIQGTSHSRWGHEATLLTCVELDPLQDLKHLREELACLAQRYHQEAIALTIGPPAEIIQQHREGVR